MNVFSFHFNWAQFSGFSKSYVSSSIDWLQNCFFFKWNEMNDICCDSFTGLKKRRNEKVLNCGYLIFVEVTMELIKKRWPKRWAAVRLTTRRSWVRILTIENYFDSPFIWILGNYYWTRKLAISSSTSKEEYFLSRNLKFI